MLRAIILLVLVVAASARKPLQLETPDNSKVFPLANEAPIVTTPAPEVAPPALLATVPEVPATASVVQNPPAAEVDDVQALLPQLHRYQNSLKQSETSIE